MRHLNHLSRLPQLATEEPPVGGGSICTGIVGDLQARLCFILEFMSSVFVPLFTPILNSKFPPLETPNEGTGADPEV